VANAEYGDLRLPLALFIQGSQKGATVVILVPLLALRTPIWRSLFRTGLGKRSLNAYAFVELNLS
jgi:hypothetical protein